MRSPVCSFVLVLGLSPSTVLIACGDGSPSSVASARAEPADDGVPPDATGADARANGQRPDASVDSTDGKTDAPCSNVDTSASKDVATQTIIGQPPELVGGTIVPGRYELTMVRDYVMLGEPAPGKPAYRGALEVTPTELIVEVYEPGSAAASVTLAYSKSGNVLEGLVRCITISDAGADYPNGKAGSTHFEATETTITIHGSRRLKLKAEPDGGNSTSAEALELYTFTR